MLWYAILILGIGLVVFNTFKLGIAYIDSISEELVRIDEENRRRNAIKKDRLDK